MVFFQPYPSGHFQNDQFAGTKGQGKRMEAFLLEPIEGATIEYRAHVQNVGWTGWLPLGQWIGTKGKGLRMEAMQFRLVDYKAPEDPRIAYLQVKEKELMQQLLEKEDSELKHQKEVAYYKMEHEQQKRMQDNLSIKLQEFEMMFDELQRELAISRERIMTLMVTVDQKECECAEAKAVSEKLADEVNYLEN